MRVRILKYFNLYRKFRDEKVVARKLSAAALCGINILSRSSPGSVWIRMIKVA